MTNFKELSKYGTFVLRLFLGVGFLVAGLDKVLSFGMAKGMFGMFFGSWAAQMLVLAIIIELSLGLALLLGYQTRLVASVLALFILVAFVKTFMLGNTMHLAGTLREIMVMNTGGGNTAVNYAYFAGLLSLALSGSKKWALRPE